MRKEKSRVLKRKSKTKIIRKRKIIAALTVDDIKKTAAAVQEIEKRKTNSAKRCT